MLLNAAPSQLIPAGNGVGPDAVRDVSSPAAVPVAPKSGRALLAVLEQQAQRELAALAAALREPPARDAAWMGLAWDLGLTGDMVD